jgi:di/tricarboxylate transporter
MENLKFIISLALLFILLLYVLTPNERVKIRKVTIQLCGGFFVAVGIVWVWTAFGNVSVDLSLLGVGLAVFALGLQFWDKAKKLSLK